LRLSEFIPEEFRLATKENQKKYGEIISDFNYFKTSEFWDQRIENNPVFFLTHIFLNSRRSLPPLNFFTFSFSLFKIPLGLKHFEQELLERDEDFSSNNIQILKRFYLLFESIFKYVKDLNRFLEDLDEGVFIQQTLEVQYSSSLFLFFLKKTLPLGLKPSSFLFT